MIPLMQELFTFNFIRALLIDICICINILLTKKIIKMSKQMSRSKKKNETVSVDIRAFFCYMAKVFGWNYLILFASIGVVVGILLDQAPTHEEMNLILFDGEHLRFKILVFVFVFFPVIVLFWLRRCLMKKKVDLLLAGILIFIFSVYNWLVWGMLGLAWVGDYAIMALILCVVWTLGMIYSVVMSGKK